jgi:hypothetical protein
MEIMLRNAGGGMRRINEECTIFAFLLPFKSGSLMPGSQNINQIGQ